MNIAICGCGWLGQPLALHLIRLGHSVTGSKRSSDAAMALSQYGISGVTFALGESDLTALDHTLFNADVLIVNIPPGRKQFSPDQYVAHMQKLLQYAATSHVLKCLFISTSAVYGEATRVVSETSPTEPQTDSAKAHVILEQAVMDAFGDSGAVLRLAGLVGGTRHPVKYLSGRTGLAHPNRRVNLVHQADVITAIEAIIANQVFGQTMHLCANEHPTREEYYCWAADKLNLAVPGFASPETPEATGKMLDASGTLKALDMQLKYASPYAMV